MQPRVQARDTNNDIDEIFENVDFSEKCQKRVLINNCYVYKTEFSNNRCNEYIYDVEFIILENIKYKKGIDISYKFQEFVNNQYKGKKFIRYDDSIRDLYPLEYHTNNKRIEDVNRFNELNGLILDKNKILSNENIITRRVTKKKIVYKKNKVNNIIAISIFKGYLNLYFSSIVEKYDDKNEVKIISERTCTNLDRVLVIKTNEDIIYAKGLLENYINELYNIILSSNKIS